MDLDGPVPFSEIPEQPPTATYAARIYTFDAIADNSQNSLL